MNLNKNLTLVEMEELISDYAFGKLTNNESIIFENNLKNFPELKDEIIAIRSAFSKVNKEEIKERLENRTANLTYKVKQKQFENKQSKISKKNITKLVLPVFVIIATFLIMRQVDFKDNVGDQESSEVILSSTEANIIFGDSADVSYYDPYYNDFYTESETNEVIENTELINNSSYNTIYNYINGMSDSEFNELINEMDDENFNL